MDIGKGCLGGVYRVAQMAKSGSNDLLIKPELQHHYPLWNIICDDGTYWANLRILGTLPKVGDEIKVLGYSAEILNDPLKEKTPKGNMVIRPVERNNDAT